MTIELLIYPGLVFLAVALTVKFIERQGDVLYGPYIWGRRTAMAELREQIDAVMISLGLRREFGRMAFKFAGVSLFASAIIG